MHNTPTIKNIPHIENKKNRELRFWTLSFIIYTIAEAAYWIFQYYINGCTSCLHSARFYFLEWLLNIVITATAWFILFQINFKKLWLVVMANTVVFAVYYFFCAITKYYLWNAAPAWLTGSENNTKTFSEIIYHSWFDIANYVLIATAFYVLKYYRQYNTVSEQRIHLSIINKKMQLNLLKQQLNPHFYFNTLNNLYGLARINSNKLTSALQQLQDIMEYVIVECNQDKVSLQKEINFLKSYIALERLRYEENARIDMYVKGEADGHTILPLLLVQLVENAFKHGMKEKSNQDWMQVGIDMKGEKLFFTVENSCCDTAYADGVGLSSVKQRLQLQYEGKYDMQINNSGRKFSVQLMVNLS